MSNKKIWNNNFQSQDKGGTRVLIVDDDVDILSALRDILELEGESYLVETASSSSAAKEISIEFKPQIVLLDIKLGNESGLDLIPSMKRDYPDIVCIMMTAYRDSEYAVSALQFGADDYLHKPIDPEGFIETVKNHSYRQKLRHDKRISDLRFRAVFDQTLQLIFLLNEYGEILEVNDTALSFVELPEEKILGHKLWDTSWWNGISVDKYIEEVIKRSLSDGQISRGEWRVNKNKGELFVFDYTIKPIIVGDDYPDLVVIECNDITRRKQTEDRLHNILATLDNRVIERTAELEVAKSAAESANNAKTEFLSRMSHELRTPMNAIMGFSQLMMSDPDEPLSETQDDNLREVYTAAKHMAHLIDEVLDMAKIESGEMIINIEPVSLGDIFGSISDQIQLQSKDQNIEIVDQLSSANHQVMADYNRLKQVLLALLSNALKHSRDPGVVTISNDVIDEKTLCISVRDSGEGLSDEKIKRIFSPFERMNKDDVEGVGIGMVVIKHLVELMGGRLGVDSKVGEGSTFWVELEIAENGR